MIVNRKVDRLAWLFAPVRYERRLDREGYAQFRRWRVYGERGLARQASLVWLSEETLTVGYAEEPLAYYTVKVNRRGELTAVTEPHVLPTGYQPVQARLWAWTPNSDEWAPRATRPSARAPSPPTASARRPVADIVALAVLAMRLLGPRQTAAQPAQQGDVRATSFTLVSADGVVLARLAPDTSGNGLLTVADATGRPRAEITAASALSGIRVLDASGQVRAALFHDTRSVIRSGIVAQDASGRPRVALPQEEWRPASLGPFASSCDSIGLRARLSSQDPAS